MGELSTAVASRRATLVDAAESAGLWGALGCDCFALYGVMIHARRT
jgi:hypothetical protein